MKAIFKSLFICSVLAIAQPAKAQQPKSYSSSEIQLALKKLNTVGCVMYVAAHPDDENTRLLSYLANERLFRTVYVSLTRGDGGQNLIGNEQGDELGLIRTQELIAARRTDGAEQYFTSAVDFGYSKSPEETFSKWDKEKVLADLVYAIRKFRPDVIINRFPTTGEGGHGHHTASAILAIEAFKAAADPKRFPEQLKTFQTWQAKRIFLNSFIPRGQSTPDMTGQLKTDVGGYNKLLGKSYGEIAADSRSMHKSQGFGVARGRGVQYEHFKKLDGDTSVGEILAGINPMWSRLEGSDDVQKWVNDAIDYYNPLYPEYSVPSLIKVYKALDGIKDVTWRNKKKSDVAELIRACLGLYLEADAKRPEAAPGQKLNVEMTANCRSFAGVVLEKIIIGGRDTLPASKLKINENLSWSTSVVIPSDAVPSEPYWLAGPSVNNHYPGDREMSGRPQNEPALKASFVVSLENSTFTFDIPVTHKFTDPVKGEVYRPFAIVPLLSIEPTDPVLLFTNEKSRKLNVVVSSLKDSVSGIIRLSLPEGWKYEPSEIAFMIPSSAAGFSVSFNLFAPAGKGDASTHTVTGVVIAESENVKYQSQVSRINYDHIPAQFHLKASEVKLVVMDMATVATRVGYLEGAGDNVAECLSAAGYNVELLSENTILEGDLSRFDAIVTGVRAYNTNERIGSYQAELMDYVKKGGVLIVQYNTSNFLGTVKSDVGPYPFKISRDRVTDENSPVNFLQKEHRVLNFPNKIKQKDFEGWVQERGLYFAGETDSLYQKVLSMSDPGEKNLDGSLIIADYGEGKFVYTGISFFRQLPAGVPGAYRLMSNLINLGKQ